jgi:enamine deaminase RidA (YjgF/YER057c/UK114 family)
MSQKHATPTGRSKADIPWFNFPGYDDHGLISAAILIPQNRRIVFTSGQVGTDSNGRPESLEDEMVLAFEVISPPSLYHSLE